jgi:pyruvate formate lyase activating enzyme
MGIINIFDIQKSSYHDGPGMRTVIFFKGCNMSCLWCQNPESKSFKKKLMFDVKKCIKCGRCVESCSNNCHIIGDTGVHYLNRESCVICGRCAKECKSNALQLAGKEVTIENVMKEILTDLEFYKISGGGVTLSGGEPLLQEDACYELLSECNRNSINTAIETAGNVKWKVFEKILPMTNYLLFDVKTLDNDIHKKYCGVSNRQIIKNLKKLNGTKVDLIIRVPIIPEINDNNEEIEEIGNKVKSFPNLKGFELIPFHKFGRSKYMQLDMKFEIDDIIEPSINKMEELREILLQMGIDAIINYQL